MIFPVDPDQFVPNTMTRYRRGKLATELYCWKENGLPVQLLNSGLRLSFVASNYVNFWQTACLQF